MGKVKIKKMALSLTVALSLLATAYGGVGFAEEAATSEAKVDAASLPEHYGASPDMVKLVTGDSLGGGEGYSDIVNPDDADYVVDTKDELLSAAAAAQSGDIIYVNDEAEIDLTSIGTQPIVIPEGVTLASGRGRDGSQGALLFTDYMKDMIPNASEARKHWINGLLLAGGPDVRITGLRIRGNHEDIGINPSTGEEISRTYDLPISLAIKSEYHIEVDNNEIYNFSYAAIYAFDAHVHHNYLHHTQRKGLGYGIILSNGTEPTKLLAEGNIFDYFRHAIAASGKIMESYEARYNLVKNGTSHSFDMHTNGKESDYLFTSQGGVFMAGNTISIHHNTFTDTDLDDGWGKVIAIRGLPVVGAYIDYNWFHNEDPYDGPYQRSSFGNFYVGNNAYGVDGDTYASVVEGAPTTQMLNEDNVLELVGEDVRQNQDGKLDFILPQEGSSGVKFPALVTPIYLWKLGETEVTVGDQRIILTKEWFESINSLIPEGELSSATVFLQVSAAAEGKELTYHVSYITKDGTVTEVNEFDLPVSVKLSVDEALKDKKVEVFRTDGDKVEMAVGGTLYGDMILAETYQSGTYSVMDSKATR